MPSGRTNLIAAAGTRDRRRMTKKPWPRHRSHDVDEFAGLEYPPDELLLGAPRALETQQADCCIAKAVYRVVLPATATRSLAAELLLCGHHFRVSKRALQRANAWAFDTDNHLCAVSG